MITKFLFSAIMLAYGASYGQQLPSPIGTDRFCGLDDIDAPATLQNCESQNTLNTETNIAGTAILKRRGFVQIAALTVATSAVTGAYYFIDKNANQQVIVCQDLNCANSVNGGAFSVIYSTASKGVARWSFADYNGIVYAVDDKNDQPWSYDGTTFTQPPSANSFPLGSLIEQSKDRLIVSGVTSNPSSIYYSQSGVFTNFVTGANSADPWVDTIGTAGDKITALKYDSGNLYIFKRNSITLCILADQYSTNCYPIANTIGTSSPMSIVSAPDGIYFQSQIGSYWRIPTYGLYGLQLISNKIYNFVKNQPSQFGAVGNNFQGSLADWNAGTQTPKNSWSSTINIGSIVNSTWSKTENTTAIFSLGTQVNVTTNTANNVTVWNPGSVVFINGGAELNQPVGTTPTNWTMAAPQTIELFRSTDIVRLNACAVPISPKFGNYAWNEGSTFSNPYNATISIYDPTGTILVSSGTQKISANMGWVAYNANLNSPYSTVVLKISVPVSDGNVTATSTPLVNGGSIPLWFNECDSGNGNIGTVFDMDETVTQNIIGSYTSCYDTVYSTPTWGPLSITESSNTLSGITFQTKVSATNCSSGFDAPVAVTPSARITSAQKEFIAYIANFTLNSSTNTPASFSYANLTAATTGQFVTQCIQPGPNITSWGLLTCDTSNNMGAGSEIFYATSAINCASLPTSAPLNGSGTLQNGWTMQTNNSALTISTNAAVLIGFRDLLGSATDQAQINSCQTNWANGIIPQSVWGIYDPVKNSIYWSTSSSGTATNNRILKYDLNIAGLSGYGNNGLSISPWFPWSINATALRMVNNLLYFGSSTGGTWNQLGAVTSNADNGAAINGYWTSKDFSCNAPFVDSVWNRTYAVARNQQGGTITQTTTNSLNIADSFSISTSTSAAQNYVRATHSINNFTAAPFVNIQFSNNVANNPFEIDGFSIDCNAQPPIDENP